MGSSGGGTNFLAAIGKSLGLQGDNGAATSVGGVTAGSVNQIAQQTAQNLSQDAIPKAQSNVTDKTNAEIQSINAGTVDNQTRQQLLTQLQTQGNGAIDSINGVLSQAASGTNAIINDRLRQQSQLDLLRARPGRRSLIMGG